MQNIKYIYESLGSAPVVAIQDALTMLHAGSVSKSDRILVEARKRYVLAICSLRSGSTGKSLEMPVSQTMILATLTVMSEVRLLFLVSCARLIIDLPIIQAYFAISYDSQQITWQKHLAGMSALVRSCQSDNRNPAIEDFLISQLRVAQVG